MRVISTFGRGDICDCRSPLSRQNRWQLPLSVLGSTALQSGTSTVSRRYRTTACIVHQASFETSTTGLRQQLHWLPIKQRITYKLATLTFKATYCRTPVYLHEQLRDHQVVRTLRSTNTPLFYQPFVSTVFASWAFYYSAPHLELSRDIHKIGEHFQ